MLLKSLIVDDEPFVREDLRQMLAVHEEIEVVGEAGTIAEAKKLLADQRCHVVFLDIQLRGGTGFDLVPHIDPATHIIFITAHDEYAVRAFEVNALDYLLKPVEPKRLAASLARLKSDRSVDNPQLTGVFKPDDRVFVKTNTGRNFVRLDEVVSVSSVGGNYVSLYMKNSETYLCRKTLKQWEALLPKSIFLRVHRSTIVNTTTIERIEYDPDGACCVCLSGQSETFPVSRRMANQVKEFVGRYSV
jgi:two-component system LytT family response regulator